VDNPEELTVLSLCTGYSGLELGLAGALANPLRVIALEVESYALANLVAKTEEGKLAVEALWPDLRTFPAERFRGCFDFVLAGYPCQPFSCAGKRKGESDPRHLWPHIARIVEAVEPLWCFFENVPGHLSLGFPDVYCSLRNMGYSVEAGLFTAAECGAPHRRQRLFILAHNTQYGRGTRRAESAGFGGQASVANGGKLADAECSESREGIGQEAQIELRRDRPAIDRWPARQGQPQYEWEEPRTVGDTEYPRQGRSGWAAQRFEHRLELQTAKTESGLGRAVDGTACVVDRLRLLGNGVVPQQAEKAFRYLCNITP
jgi:DNA (cytosine-5)-methyltransferase 1